MAKISTGLKLTETGTKSRRTLFFHFSLPQSLFFEDLNKKVHFHFVLCSSFFGPKAKTKQLIDKTTYRKHKLGVEIQTPTGIFKKKKNQEKRCILVCRNFLRMVILSSLVQRLQLRGSARPVKQIEVQALLIHVPPWLLTDGSAFLRAERSH